MALPTTITGLNVNVPICGPFISSGGNVYLFGRDGTTATTLQAYKATDPTSSFSSAATDTGFSSEVFRIAGVQVSDVIHLAILDGTTTSQNLKYRTFDMSSDSFVTSETVHSGFDPRESSGQTISACSIVYRASDSQPIILYMGPRVANMGSSYSRIVYARRTGAATWTTNVAVDSGGTSNWVNPEAVMGSSSRAHFFWYLSGGSTVNQRALNSSSALQTASTAAGGLSASYALQAVSYDSSGTQKVACVGDDGTNLGTVYFDAVDSPTLSVGTEYAGTGPARLFNDTTDVWALYRKASDSDLYVRKSTDHGATFGAETSAMTATVSDETPFHTSSATAKLSIDGNIFTRGSSVVIPYVVNDGGTLKYNEHVVRTVSSNKTLTADGGSYTVTGTAAGVLVKRKVVADAGSYAVTGTNATLRRNIPVVAAAGSYALSGADAALRQARKIAADAGAYAVSGTDATINKGQRLAADGGSYALSGTDAALRHAWRVTADAGSYAVSGTDAALHRNIPVVAGAGSYVVGGTDASVLHGWKTVAAAGSYALTGTNATLLHGWKIAASAGSYALTGSDAALTTASQKVLSAEGGAYSFNGTNATLLHAKIATAGAGSYLIAGSDAAILWARLVTADPGAYVLSGQDATLSIEGMATPESVDSGAGTGRKRRKKEEWKVIPLDVWLKTHHPEESVEKQTEAVEELTEEIEEAPPSAAARVAFQLSAETQRVDSLVSELKSEGRRVAGLADLLADLADYRDALLDAKRAAEKRMKEAKRKITDMDDEEALMVIIQHAL